MIRSINGKDWDLIITQEDNERVVIILKHKQERYIESKDPINQGMVFLNNEFTALRKLLAEWPEEKK